MYPFYNEMSPKKGNISFNFNQTFFDYINQLNNKNTQTNFFPVIFDYSYCILTHFVILIIRQKQYEYSDLVSGNLESHI